ncbi:hypothetical protein G210_2555 [Candida maltosa Xu316]|uniref:RRM domain-containing protein n=1 Tax=Candida maltosa (strain Xu316) TaxID=1245528 RepID=M3ILB6_CANMX|nr:hypothetical protein G210_2555 [Candida maltosa Xu316]
MSFNRGSGFRPRGYSSNYNNRGRGSSRGRYGAAGQPTSYRGGRPSSSSSSSSHPAYKSRQNLYQQHTVTPRHNELQLWMGDLEPDWTEEWIERLWTKLVAKPQQVKLIRDRLQPSKASYCFVTFSDQDAVNLALQRNGQKVPDSNKVFKLNQSGKYPTNDRTNSPASSGDYSLFIGDLGGEVTDAILFSKFNFKYPNQIKQAKVIYDLNTQRSKGFGFVKVYSQEVMQRAMKEMQGYIIGSKAIRVGLAAGSNPDTTSQQPTASIEYHKVHVAQQQPALNELTDPNNTSLTIHGLSSKFTEQELELYFLGFGDLIYCRISDDLQTGYVKFYLRSAAETAILNLHGYVINDCRLKISWDSSIRVDGDSVNYAPNISGDLYEKAEKPPRLYVACDYPYQRLDRLTGEEVNKLSHRVDGSDALSTNTIDELFLNAKKTREDLLNRALY